MDDMKCVRCGENKPASEFEDGKSWCTPCRVLQGQKTQGVPIEWSDEYNGLAYCRDTAPRIRRAW